MPTAGEAQFAFIKTLIDEQRKLEEEERRITTRERKKKGRSGLGSILGTLVGALLTGGGSAIATGLGAGLGSRFGSEIGERTVGGSSRIGGDFMFRQPQIAQRNFQQRELDRGFGEGQTLDAILKGITAGTFQPEISKFLGKGSGLGSTAVSQLGSNIGTGRGVNVVGDVLRGGSREGLRKGLAQQGQGLGGSDFKDRLLALLFGL